MRSAAQRKAPAGVDDLDGPQLIPLQPSERLLRGPDEVETVFGEPQLDPLLGRGQIGDPAEMGADELEGRLSRRRRRLRGLGRFGVRAGSAVPSPKLTTASS